LCDLNREGYGNRRGTRTDDSERDSVFGEILSSFVMPKSPQ
jgi:hypothetical protein